MCFTDSILPDTRTRKVRVEPDLARSKSVSCLTFQDTRDLHCPILPGLPDDVAKRCLARVAPPNFPAMGGVSKQWRSFIKSKEFINVREQAGLLEEWLYVLTMERDGIGNHWDILDHLGRKNRQLPAMPGPVKAGFGVVVVNGKLLVMAGQSIVNGTTPASADVYQYDPFLNRACAEVNGRVFAVGGYGITGESLSCAEVYDPDTNKWTIIESLRRPRWGCFACGFEGKLYVMGGRSSFTIGNSRKVDVYDPESHTWSEMKNGCVMITTHAVLEKKLFCMEWKNERKLAIFNAEDNSWKMVPIPVTGSTRIGFKLGILDGKLLLFSLQKGSNCNTLLYDPNAAPGSEWLASQIKPSGRCVCSVTIKA